MISWLFWIFLGIVATYISWKMKDAYLTGTFAFITIFYVVISLFLFLIDHLGI